MKRFATFFLALAILVSAIPFLPVEAAAASNTWPDLSPSCYASYVAPASTSKLYQDSEMSVRGTASPRKAYNSSISRGDELQLLGFTADKDAIIVSYPVGQSRRIAYVPTKTLLGVSNPVEVVKSQARVSTYQITGKVTKTGSVFVDDLVYRCGTTADSKYILVIYEAVSGNRGWRVAFVSVSDYAKIKGSASTQDSSRNTTSDAVKARLDAIGNGSLKYNKNTIMKIGSTFSGTRSGEECKGFAKNVYYLCFGITPGSTQSRSKGLNHLLNSTTGMTKVGSVTNMTVSNVFALFSQARPGDFVQMRRSHGGSHSAIVYSVTSNGVTFFEANLDGHNTIYLCTYSWSDLCNKNAAMSVYTASNYKLK